MKTGIKNLSVFVCICTVITLLLALTNAFTAPLILKNQNASANQALLEVMPDGEGFEAVSLESYTLPATVKEVYRETSGQGYVVKLVTTGYGSDMTIMCGVDANGVVTGAVCISSNETLGKEKTYGENFTDKDAAGVEAVDVIGGAAGRRRMVQDDLVGGRPLAQASVPLVGFFDDVHITHPFSAACRSGSRRWLPDQKPRQPQRR